MIKKIHYLAVLLLVFFTACSPANSNKKEQTQIRINQIGYYPHAVKKAVVVNTSSKDFALKSKEGKTVFKSQLTKGKHWDKSGENVKIADFTSFTKPGEYYLQVGKTKSCTFAIKDNLYADAFHAALKSYYYIRTGMDIDEKYAGKWHRKAGHPDTLCYFHPSAERGEGHAPSPKGWYDAGDYNKYVVNGGVTVGTLLALAEMYPDRAADKFSNIPESGNGKSDLLDEIKYELDWIMTMQTPDGASNMKLTSKGFTGFIMPEKDKTDRYFVGKGTAATLNFAAMMAMAGRIYKAYDPAFAQKCLNAAEKAWQWAEKHPDVPYTNPPDIKTGEYGDTDFTEEFWWAASELYLATHGEDYEKYLLTHKPYMTFIVGESWRVFLGNLGSFSLIMSPEELPDKLKEKLDAQLLRTANQLLDALNKIPYRIPIDEFVWGSNSDIQNAAMVLAYAYKITGDKKYLDGVVETMDYIFGKNATGYSFMTGFGCKTPMHVHNRICGGDTIVEPIPGLIAGGPNNDRQDMAAGVVYPDTLPAKSYVDVEPSFASNETAINWNAPAVFVLGFLQANADKLN